MASDVVTPVEQATNQSGMSSPLDLTPLQAGLGDTSPQTYSQPDLASPDLSSLYNTDYSTDVSNAFPTPSTSDASATPTTSSTSSNVLSDIENILFGAPGAGLSGLGPYAAVGALGINQAKDAQSQAQAQANTLSSLGSPYIQAGQQLLQQFQSGQIRPDQQAVVDTAKQQGQTLIDSGSTLSAIAQQAYTDYQNGTLPAGDEQKLQAQVTQQKQQIRQQLASQGITDSSILAGYDQSIDNQATMTRQNLLDARFATGNQAYDEWLKSTEAGQQLQLQGEQFASTALDNTLTQSLGLASEGMQPVEQAVQLAIQSDQQLSQQISDLIGNLAAAYSYAASGPGAKSGGTGSASGGGLLGNILGNSTVSNLIKSLGGSDFTSGDLSAVESGTQAALTTDLAPTLGAPDLGAAVPDSTGDGDLYQGSANSDADFAASEAEQYAAGGGLAAAVAASAPAAAPAASVGVYDLAGNLLAGGAPADAAATGVAADAAASSTGAGAGAGAGSGLSGAVGAAVGWAAAVGIPAATIYAMFNDSGSFTAGGFVNSVVGSGYFTPAQNQELQQKYQELGEDGFWQWFNNDPTFQAFASAQKNTGNNKASYKPT